MKAVDTNASRRTGKHGFALVITLIMVVLAAIIAITVMTNASLERTTARSVQDRVQAEVAAQNGLEAAKKVLVGSPDANTCITADDAFVVFRVDGAQAANPSGNKDTYYFVAKPKPRDPSNSTTTTVDCYPLFAGASPTPATIDHSNYPPIPRPQVPQAAYASSPAQDPTGSPYPVLYPHLQRAYTQWQEMKDPNDTATAPNHDFPYQRYTFWVEDLAGYLDASVVGNEEDPGSSHKRDKGVAAKEIALFTIFDPKINSDSGATVAKNLIDKRPLLFTVPTLKQVAPPANDQDTTTDAKLAVRLGIDTGGERNLIPFGFGYLDEGKARTNLNTLLTGSTSADGKVTAIAKVINDNLPKLANLRKGGFPTSSGDDYVKTVAANILDYADTDSDATVGTGYRGIDAYPFVVEFFNRYNWEGGTNYYAKGNPATWWAKVHLTGYAQLWNMTNRDVTSGTLEFTDIDRYGVKVGSNDYKFDDGTFTIDFSTTPLNANAFGVYKLYDKTYEFDSGVSTSVNPPSTSNSKIKLGQQGNVTADHYESGYIVKWNGKIVDRAGAGTRDGSEPTAAPTGPNTVYASLNYHGLGRKAAALQTAQSQLDPSWRGTYPGLRYDDQSESIYNLGDPRSAYYIGRDQAAVFYAHRPSDSSGGEGNSAWYGRAYQQALINPPTPPQKWFAAETLVSNWPDGDHKTTEGLIPTSTRIIDPLSVTGNKPTTEGTKAPVTISNAGSFTSIAELGRIYDPIQWRPTEFKPTAGSTKPASSAETASVWKDAWKNDFISDSNYGNGTTLRIGTPEFKQFDKDDSRAARLLDLFSVADRTDTRGLININTASRNVLRSLGAGIQIKSDSAMIPSPSTTPLYGPVADPANPAQADKFADAVISNRPFLAASQLAGIRVDPNDATTQFFGNATQWASNGPTEWNDSAREEYFSRMFGLTSVRSRNFRVFVTGQALDKNGRVTSTVNRVFQVYLSPTRDRTGKITKQEVKVTYEKDL